MSNRAIKFPPDDWVEVKKPDEIARTLDVEELLDNLSRTAMEEVELA
jgi:hypothetical protein